MHRWQWTVQSPYVPRCLTSGPLLILLTTWSLQMTLTWDEVTRNLEGCCTTIGYTWAEGTEGSAEQEMAALFLAPRWHRKPISTNKHSVNSECYVWKSWKKDFTSRSRLPRLVWKENWPILYTCTPGTRCSFTQLFIGHLLWAAIRAQGTRNRTFYCCDTYSCDFSHPQFIIGYKAIPRPQICSKVLQDEWCVKWCKPISPALRRWRLGDLKLEATGASQWIQDGIGVQVSKPSYWGSRDRRMIILGFSIPEING